MKKKFMLLFLLIVFLSTYSFFSRREEVYKFGSNSNLFSQENKAIININGKSIHVDVANTPKLLEKGLSGVGSIKQNGGMLFVFDIASQKFFWMKDMNFPIDIIWINEENKIIGVVENASPSSYPKTFSSPTETKYVLEVNAGYFAKNDIKIGDIASIISK